jgi:hypothetical protein
MPTRQAFLTIDRRIAAGREMRQEFEPKEYSHD